jgi:hypothetical protein
MMETVRTSETLINFHQSTRRCNPEDSQLPAHSPEKVKYFFKGYSYGIALPDSRNFPRMPHFVERTNSHIKEQPIKACRNVTAEGESDLSFMVYR